MKYKGYFSLLFVFITFAAVSQILKGNVVNSFNEPLEDVYIINKKNNYHTHTNQNGYFLIENITLGTVLEMSILGYKKRAVTVTNQMLQEGVVIVLETTFYQLDELVLRNEINAMQTISNIDLQVNPVNNSQEILRKVPGLIIGQHAGGGKAEQLFLRGFDVDHGTDVALNFDGMPVNMVSHAHGQGYSDLHFVIPETIQKIDFGKGPYYAQNGDFNTAGYVNFSSKTTLKNNLLSFESGQFNSNRIVALVNLFEDKKQESAYIALENINTDGPFESSQNFNRFNIFGKYTTFLKGTDRVSVSASHFTSTWDASGQIPERAVKNGTISRFGAIDDTEGGTTSRTNINIQYRKTIADNSYFTTNVFYSKYDFELFSNFTFFLEDPINGDQIKQHEDRAIFGANAQILSNNNLGDFTFKLTKGAGFRFDNINDNQLLRTKNRTEILEEIQSGDVRQNNMYAFLNADFEIGKFKISPALRFDYFKFNYNNVLTTNYSTLSKTKAIVNPKLNFLYTPNQSIQWFLKSGIGFHSNDARVVLQQGADKVLPRAYGVDFGAIWKPANQFVLNAAAWYLFSEEEFVYVGDAGIVEPSGESERFGLDIGFRYQLTDWLYIDSDATITKARSLEAIKGEDFIPLAPDLTIAGGLSFNNLGNFSGGFRYRFIDDRPANEDNSIIAEGYFVADFNINYQLGKTTFGIAVDNIFDTNWNETQFATNSRLQNETLPVEEIHFTPGTPFFARASIKYQF
ncbi:TonB-dependent receptor [Polaribacter tangerinus]|uniref:TonB-dependent receptor n=1 Tax=Polaribacter tangerinus TaxID=1920034 RepID=UPI000B4B4476|nr:TonB-dependent receptor plug domain-containing protein [Polaribacter tangerinus]